MRALRGHTKSAASTVLQTVESKQEPDAALNMLTIQVMRLISGRMSHHCACNYGRSRKQPFFSYKDINALLWES